MGIRSKGQRLKEEEGQSELISVDSFLLTNRSPYPSFQGVFILLFGCLMDKKVKPVHVPMPDLPWKAVHNSIHPSCRSKRCRNASAAATPQIHHLLGELLPSSFT